MRDPADWDEQYLLHLPVGEFDWLEAKGRQALDLTLPTVREADVKERLSKAVSAFANSGGRIVVLGAANPQTGWHIDDGGIDLAVKKPSTREWLEDVVPTLVDHPLPSLNVYVVQASDPNSQIHPGRGVFILDIPDSDHAPHQATDNRYYARVGGKSRPIGHRMVADIFGRRQHPKIYLDFQIEIRHYDDFPFRLPALAFPGHQPATESNEPRHVKLVTSARNVGRVLAQYVNAQVYIPTRLVPKTDLEHLYNARDFHDIDGQRYVVWTRLNTRRDRIELHEYGPSWFDPILPSLTYDWNWELSDLFDKDPDGALKFVWEVYADNAAPQYGSCLVRDIEVTEIEPPSA
jgi:hypothetical protein